MHTDTLMQETIKRFTNAGNNYSNNYTKCNYTNCACNHQTNFAIIATALGAIIMYMSDMIFLVCIHMCCPRVSRHITQRPMNRCIIITNCVMIITVYLVLTAWFVFGREKNYKLLLALFCYFVKNTIASRHVW